MSDDGYTRITLRIPDGLHSKLTAEAARTSKSMNAEIVARLESSFQNGIDGGFHRDFLNDIVFQGFEEEEDAALRKIDKSSVKGLVEWLELIDTYNEKRERLEAMIDEAMAIYEARKADSALRISDKATGHYLPPKEVKAPKPRAKKPK